MENAKKPRNAYHHGDLRAALIASARALVTAGGTESFSLREAARAVGVSANAAYRHFDDKAALLAAVAADGFARLAAEMEATAPPVDAPSSRRSPGAARGRAAAHGPLRGLSRPAADAVEALRSLGRAYVVFAHREPSIFRLMFGPAGLPLLRAGASTEASHSSSFLPTTTPLDLLEQALDRLVTVGLLPRPRRALAASSAWSAVHGYASLTLDLGGFGAAPLRGDDGVDPALEALLDFTVSGLCSAGVNRS